MHAHVQPCAAPMVHVCVYVFAPDRYSIAIYFIMFISSLSDYPTTWTCQLPVPTHTCHRLLQPDGQVDSHQPSPGQACISLRRHSSFISFVLLQLGNPAPSIDSRTLFCSDRDFSFVGDGWIPSQSLETSLAMVGHSCTQIITYNNNNNNIKHIILNQIIQMDWDLIQQWTM